jgi:NADPH:quinone reductase-like Zn-dependent oxidoreductase
MTASWLGPIRQISYTTDDLDRLVQFWERQVGIGPWSVFRNITLSMAHDGRPIVLHCDVALTMHGETLIELMQVAGQGPSPFHDGMNRPIVGLQRLAAFSQAIEADTQSAIDRGMERFAAGVDPTGQRYVYLRSPDAPGVILELLEVTPFFGDFVGRLEARAQAYRQSTANAATATTGTGAKVVSSEASPRFAAASTASMQVAELDDYGGPDRFRIVSIPEPTPGPGEIRVKVAAAAVNPVDIKLRRGYLKAWMPLAFPARIGGDFAGTVDAIGESVHAFKVGDRVMGMINPMANGAYGEKVVAAATALAIVPPTLDLADAAALPTGAMTGTQLVEHAIKPAARSKGLVTGAAGSVGRAAVFAALDAGAEVYAGVRASAFDACRDLPVAGLIDLGDEQAIAAAAPFDFVADTVGGTVAESLFAHVKPAGVVASVAVPPPTPPPGSTQRFESLIVSSDRSRLEQFARDLASKNRRMPVAHRLPFAEVARAHELMERGGVGGKILLVLSDPAGTRR